MSRPYVFTPEAADDLLAIWKYIADDTGEAPADRVVQQIFAEC